MCFVTVAVAVGGEAFSVVVLVGISSTGSRSKSCGSSRSSGSRFYQVAFRQCKVCGGVEVELFWTHLDGEH